MISSALILLSVATVSALGGWFTSLGIFWYNTILALPSFTPDGSVIGTVWIVLYILIAISAIFYWHRSINQWSNPITWVFITNLFLNLLWPFIFFTTQSLGPAFYEILALDLTTLILLLMLWGKHRFSAYLLVPYFFWVCFASFLNYSIWVLNRS